MRKTGGDGIVGRKYAGGGDVVEQDDELDDQGQADQAPQQPSAARSAMSQRVSALAKGGLSTGTQAAGAAAGGPAGAVAARAATTALASPALPALLVLLLVLMTLGAVLMIGFAICVSNGCMGKDAFPTRFDPAGSRQDSLELKTIKCLQESAKPTSADKEAVPQACLEPIQRWSQQVIDEVKVISEKISPNDTDGAAAKKLLDDLLATATTAHATTATTPLKEARITANTLAEQYKKAGVHPLIAKHRGFSSAAQEIITFCSTNACDQISVTGRSNGCQDTNEYVLKQVFGGNPESGDSLGNANTSGAPTEQELETARRQLSAGNIPIWHVRGNGVGQHWIMLLRIDGTTITYFDPADGEIHNDPSTMPSKYTWYFGSPSNATERGYSFPAGTQ